MSNAYIRSIELIVGKTRFNSDDFTINFNVPFDDGEDANIAEIEVFNLADTTLANLENGQAVILNGGYQSDLGAILIGEVLAVRTDWESVDKITTINVLDATDKWMQKEVDQTFKEGIKAKQILNALIPHTGLEVGELSLPVNKEYVGGKTINDKVGKEIVNIAEDCGAKIHINKGKLFIRGKHKGDKTGVLINKDNGLIGSPAPIEKREKIPTPKTTDDTERIKRKGWKVTALLNYNISTDAIIKVESKTANGFFRVEKGEHIATSSTFYSELEVYPV